MSDKPPKDYESPDWEAITVTDWKNFVPKPMRATWKLLDLEQKAAVAMQAEEVASRF